MTAQQKLRQLAETIRRCRLCRLSQSRTLAVPGEGPVGAQVLLIGEAPGAKEDEAGRPFVGPSGRFLNELFAGIGLPREHCFITSVVKCHPPKNRAPRADEMTACREYLDHQIALVDAPLLVCLGGVALKALTGLDKLAQARGRPLTYGDRPLLATYHPAAGMRFPEAETAMRRDFQELGKRLP